MKTQIIPGLGPVTFNQSLYGMTAEEEAEEARIREIGRVGGWRAEAKERRRIERKDQKDTERRVAKYLASLPKVGTEPVATLPLQNDL